MEEQYSTLEAKTCQAIPKMQLSRLHLKQPKGRIMEQVKDALSDNESFFWDVIEATDDAILLTDENGFLSFISPNAASLFGLHVEEVWQIEHISTLMGEGLFDLAELKRAKTIRHIEFQLKTCRGETRTLLINVKEVALREGSILYCCRDITQATKAAQVLRDLERMKIEFIVMAAHELSTPLSIVQSYAELLLRQPDMGVDSRQRSLATIFDQAQKLTQITNDFVELSGNWGNQRFHLRKSLVYAKDLVERVISKTRHKVQAHHLEERLPDSRMCLQVNQDRIERVLQTLLETVGMHSKLSGKIILCGQQRGSDFAFLIANEAIDMCQEQQCKLFDRFFQADDSNTAFPEPNFAMSIARKIVEEHGGRIRHESTSGKGARFFFSVPLVEEITGHE